MTTTRWRSPITLRMERFAELQAKKKYADLLGAEFMSALEKRLDLLEGRFYKGLAIQIPLFFMLAFSLLNVDVKTTLLGFSVESAKSLREIVLFISIPVALVMAAFQLEQASVKEMLKASIRRVASSDPDLTEFLEVRYGLSYFTSKPYGSLNFGSAQLIALILLILIVYALAALMLLAVTVVQIGNLREIYLHPNFSPAISKLVIVVVIVGDVALVLMAFLTTMVQPYQSMEDATKLIKLAHSDPEKFREIISQMVKVQRSKGWIRRTFGRIKMKPLP